MGHMRPFPAHPPFEKRLTALLRRQHGVVARGQLRALGLTDSQIKRRVSSGVLLRVDRGVYAAGHDRLTERGRWMAGVLGSGKGAALSHRSAGALWRLFTRSMPFTDVTVPRATNRRGRRGVVVHLASHLPLQDVARKDGIPVTKPARTLLDLAEVLNRRALERALDEAERLRLCRRPALLSVIDRSPGRAGAARLAAVLEDHQVGSTATENDFEELLIGLCDANGLPRPEAQVQLGPYRPDFCWRAARVIVETDGFDSHSTRRAFEGDRERDVELEVSDWKVLRFTWRHLTRKPDWVVAKLAEALASQP